MNIIFHSPFRRVPRAIAAMCICFCLTAAIHAEEKKATEPQPVVHRVTGLFSPDRQDDLREVMKKLPLITLVSIDYDNGLATFLYDSAKALPGTPKGKEVEGLNNVIRNASSSTFGIKPLSTTSKDKLTAIEIPVIGLDCKACCFVAYSAIYQIDGVERATVSFKEGRVIAWIDPAKTQRTALEEALKKRGVTLPEPAPAKPAK